MLNNEILFFQREKDPWLFPHMKVLHRFPDMLPKFRIDAGGIKPIFNGSDIMAPGLLTEGAHMDEVEANTVVAIYCEGKEHALGVGLTLLSTQQIREKKTGKVVQQFHNINDKLYQMKDISKKK